MTLISEFEHPIHTYKRTKSTSITNEGKDEDEEEDQPSCSLPAQSKSLEQHREEMLESWIEKREKWYHCLFDSVRSMHASTERTEVEQKEVMRMARNVNIAQKQINRLTHG